MLQHAATVLVAPEQPIGKAVAPKQSTAVTVEPEQSEHQPDKADGSIERHKARLVAKGFNQVPDQDFFDTFSPVLKLTMAPRVWFNRLHSFLLSVGFQASKTYVDLGEPGFFLGIETVKCDDGILLSQQRYMNDTLKLAGMAECKPLSTLIPVSKFVPFSADFYDDPTQYRSLAGALQYLTITRPDPCFAVNQLCQHMHALTESHWEQLKRVLRYVKGTITFGLHIRKSVSKELHVFSDSDWVGCLEDRKFTSGYAVFLGFNLVSWVCKKQRTVARSSTATKF
ncbi:PREDICTED: uncharacterized protein LOC109174393 [Ipomoea nil]|uniref:uncharacterized protein LOC109174393 n=1 Tax=Ipomoea nil TaxID=35883 RepID=UPI0009015C55|nr:PREDICTED: uncharacterized protein LOC109174393 [Ipomoea nil]